MTGSTGHQEEHESWLRRLLVLLLGRRGTWRRRRSKSLFFRKQYEHFRDILTRNDRTLELIADLEDVVAGRVPLEPDTLARRLRRTIHDVSVMITDLNEVSQRRHVSLHAALNEIREQLEDLLPPDREAFALPVTVPLTSVRGSQVRLVGAKMARLAEAWWSVVGMEVPPGFVITTAAFAQFMNHNALWDQVDQLDGLPHRTHDPAVIASAAEELQRAVREGALPPAVSSALLKAYDQLSGSADLAVAVRSSAVDEDGIASHAGQYHTELQVRRQDLLEAYRKVLASAFSPAAVVYRLENHLSVADVRMAVGVLAMVQPKWSGVLFSRDFAAPQEDRLVLSAVPGLAAELVGGTKTGEEFVVNSEGQALSGNTALLGSTLPVLVKCGRLLEGHFRQPQDIEWAIDDDNNIIILQSRPLKVASQGTKPQQAIGEGHLPLLDGGFCACPGVAQGLVFHYQEDATEEPSTEDQILVASHSTTDLSRFMSRCAAIVTEVGSPTGHMAIVAREFDVPCIVGLPEARQKLPEGQVVTVDATHCRIFAGHIPLPPGLPVDRSSRRPVPSSGRSELPLAQIVNLVAPLHLTQPNSQTFRPQSCQTLHDITRYVHEKVFGVMFHFGDMAEADDKDSLELNARLPFKVLLYDVGGGIREDRAERGLVQPSEVTSKPLGSFLSGLLDPRIRWDQPRPVSTRGFLSVVGEAMAGPPPDSQNIGRTSYAVVSDKYLNFSTKAGYHFSTVDAYSGTSLNKNYVHFRFSGGGASPARRTRRVRFLSLVLNELDFQTTERGDDLVARFRKHPSEAIGAHLKVLGQLTMVTRQLDMLMDSDASPDFFARNFLEGKLEAF